MRSLLTIIAVGIFSFAVFSVSTDLALADKPIKLDEEGCLALENDLISADEFIECELEASFDNLGDLIVTAKNDELTFILLNSLIPSVDFGSPSQAVTTVAKCGLMSLLVDLIAEENECLDEE